MPADGQLFANAFESGQSFIFDLTDPAAPRIVRQFGDVAGFSHPHSFLRMPNGGEWLLPMPRIRRARWGGRTDRAEPLSATTLKQLRSVC
jgi:hypothetical protein